MIKDKIAFDQTHDGYRFLATYLKEPAGDALIEISKDGENVREFLWPAYKIWNIAAHAQDIVDGLKQQSDDGLRLAGATGFGGNVYNG